MSKKNLICVDDDVDILRVIEIAFEFEGDWTVTSFPDSLGFVSQLDSLPSPDLILLDVSMPGFDGYELCTMLREHSRFGSVPIVFLTARNRSVDHVNGMAVGATSIIRKPFDPFSLVSDVKQIADSEND